MSPAPSRALGASAALVVLVGVPLVAAPAKEDKPAPVKGTLTIDVAGASAGSEPYLIRTTGPVPAPTAPATLRDATGKHIGTVTPVPGRCAATTARVAFPDQADATEWCLSLEHAAAGAELTGTVSSGANELALTVHRRDAFWALPTLILLLGLAGGLLIALVPRWLRTFVRQLVLQRMITDNDSKDAAETITGLTAWVRERLTQGDTREALITAVQKVTSTGPARAAAARARLRAAITASSLPENHPLRVAATAIATSTTNAIDDFFAGAEERKQHPADEWAAAVAQLAAYQTELAGQLKALSSIDRDIVKPAQDAYKVAELEFGKIAGSDQVARLTPFLDQLRLAVDQGLVETANRRRVALHRRAFGSEEAMALVVPQVERSIVDVLIPLDLSAGTLAGWELIAKTATGLLLTIVMVYAFFTIKHAGYDPKPLFHDAGDYLTLFSTALASGAAATVIALVGAWSPAPTSEDT